MVARRTNPFVLKGDNLSSDLENWRNRITKATSLEDFQQRQQLKWLSTCKSERNTNYISRLRISYEYLNPEMEIYEGMLQSSGPD